MFIVFTYNNIATVIKTIIYTNTGKINCFKGKPDSGYQKCL